MFKNFVLKILMISSIIPFLSYAMEDPDEYKNELFELLDISKPLDRDDYLLLRDFAMTLAWQDEFMTSANSLISLGHTSQKKEEDVIEFIDESDFMFAIPINDEYKYGMNFEKIQSDFAASVFLQLKDFLQKVGDFTEKDKILANKLAANPNDEVRFVGEFKKKAIQEAEASEQYYLAFQDLQRKWFNLKQTDDETPKQVKDKLQELLRAINSALAYEPNVDDPLEVHINIFNGLKGIYNEAYEKNKLNKLYQEARKILRAQPDAKTWLSYETLGQETTLLPTSLEVLQVELKPVEPPSTEKEKKSAKPPSAKKKKKPLKKTKKKKKPQKAKSKKPVEKIKDTEIASEIIEQLEIEQQGLATWYNEHFPVTDGSSVAEINDYQITIEDPKNNAQIILFRKSQDDEKIVSSPLNYDARVERWFENPHQALDEDNYAQKYESQLKLNEFTARHNFAQITDAFLDKEGVESQHIDKYGRAIPVKLLAGELQLLHPDGIKKISGIFSYGKDPQEDKYYHRYFSDKEYKDIIKEYYAESKWEVDFPPLGK